MREKYLPIGTIVLLKGGKKRAMITGFCSTSQEDQSKIYDYSGCVYPEGYLSSDQVCLFDHNQIEKIFFVGYEDEEEKAFKDKLAIIVENLSRQNNYEQVESNDNYLEVGLDNDDDNDDDVLEEQTNSFNYEPNSQYSYIMEENDASDDGIRPFSE